MSMDRDPDPNDMSAAEYALGTLSAAERLDFERRLTSDADLRRALERWQARLSPLSGALAPVAPPPDLWSAIEGALPPVATRPKLELIHGGGGPDKLRLRIARWRRAAIGLGSLAAALLVALVGREATRPPDNAQAFVAVVNRDGDQPALIVRVDLASGTVLVRPVAAETPRDKSLELWYIAQGDKPKSMGLVADAPLKLTLPVAADGDQLATAVFAVTVEPRGGSPSGGPTGAIVYKGQLIRE